MIGLFLLDILIYNVTPYNIPLFLLALPQQKSFKLTLVLFLILSFFEYRYLVMLAIIFFVYICNKKLNKYMSNNSLNYIIELIIDYAIYFLLTSLTAIYIL